MPWADINRTVGAGCALKKLLEIVLTLDVRLRLHPELSVGPMAQPMSVLLLVLDSSRFSSTTFHSGPQAQPMPAQGAALG